MLHLKEIFTQDTVGISCGICNLEKTRQRDAESFILSLLDFIWIVILHEMEISVVHAISNVGAFY